MVGITDYNGHLSHKLTVECRLVRIFHPERDQREQITFISMPDLYQEFYPALLIQNILYHDIFYALEMFFFLRKKLPQFQISNLYGDFLLI